jgi:hypothetical protein
VTITSRSVSILIAIPVVVMTCGCDTFNPNRQIRTQDTAVPLIAVSPEVDHILSAEKTRHAQASQRVIIKGSKEASFEQVEKFLWDPELEYPGHGNFLAAMAQQPSLTIPPKSYLRILEDSKAKCDNPRYTTNFIKVRVTSGPLEGRIGWVCEDYVYRTVVWP